MKENSNPLEHFPTIKKTHTDMLKEKYGPIHAEILEHNELIREALLLDEKNITRTYALTFFPEATEDPEVSKIDAEIRKGGMIGETFRDNGFEIRKNVIDVFIIDVPSWLKDKFAVEENHAKARISEFYAKKEGAEPVVYGYVLEVYTPDFRPAEINNVDMMQVNPSTEMFAEIGIIKDKVWGNLGDEPRDGLKDNKWSYLGDEFKKAKMKTGPLVFKLKGEMEEKINSRK